MVRVASAARTTSMTSPSRLSSSDDVDGWHSTASESGSVAVRRMSVGASSSLIITWLTRVSRTVPAVVLSSSKGLWVELQLAAAVRLVVSG